MPIADLIFTMRGVTANELTMLRTNGGTFNGNGNNREALSQQTHGHVPGGQGRQARPSSSYANPSVLSTRK